MTLPTATASRFDYTEGVDYPVRVEVPMPRDLFDRLTEHDHAPVCRYEEATGLAEFVAMPTLSHEGRAALVERLFFHVELLTLEARLLRRILVARSVRLMSDDGAFEADTSLFVNSRNVITASGIEGYLDTRQGHPVPDLVVEVDRSVNSKRKLRPYFAMGVREAWTWSKRDGARIWIPDPAGDGARIADLSTVLPGVSMEALDRLLADGFRDDQLGLSREMARQVVAGWSR
ncbi:MAG: Uma2 family endonuclease [Gammaproteobacteria bacterium]|nr:Uma2 family endonuclease [Gammaproteobacteria bacterium]